MLGFHYMDYYHNAYAMNERLGATNCLRLTMTGDEAEQVEKANSSTGTVPPTTGTAMPSVAARLGKVKKAEARRRSRRKLMGTSRARVMANARCWNRQSGVAGTTTRGQDGDGEQREAAGVAERGRVAGYGDDGLRDADGAEGEDRRDRQGGDDGAARP